MAVEIEDGRINGKRITIYNVYQYTLPPDPFSFEEIADILSLTREELQAALDYIADNRDQVHAVHLEIEVRIARGNSPEVEEKLKDTRQRMQAWLEERRRVNGQGDHRAGHSGGR